MEKQPVPKAAKKKRNKKKKAAKKKNQPAKPAGGKPKAKHKGAGGADSEDYSNDDDEGQDGYRPGGYHPVKIGDIFNERYHIKHKLG